MTLWQSWRSEREKSMWHDHFLHLATYNQWANTRLFDAVSQLSDEAYRADRGAFFGSIHGTLNHLLMADLLWIGRIAPPAFVTTGYDMIVEDERRSLRQRREAVDKRIIDTIKDLRKTHSTNHCLGSPWKVSRRAPGSTRCLRTCSTTRPTTVGRFITCSAKLATPRRRSISSGLCSTRRLRERGSVASAYRNPRRQWDACATRSDLQAFSSADRKTSPEFQSGFAGRSADNGGWFAPPVLPRFRSDQ